MGANFGTKFIKPKLISINRRDIYENEQDFIFGINISPKSHFFGISNRLFWFISFLQKMRLTICFAFRVDMHKNTDMATLEPHFYWQEILTFSWWKYMEDSLKIWHVMVLIVSKLLLANNKALKWLKKGANLQKRGENDLIFSFNSGKKKFLESIDGKFWEKLFFVNRQISELQDVLNYQTFSLK